MNLRLASLVFAVLTFGLSIKQAEAAPAQSETHSAAVEIVSRLIAESTLPGFANWLRREDIFTNSPMRTTVLAGSVPLMSAIHYNEQAAAFINSNLIKPMELLPTKAGGNERQAERLPAGAAVAMTAWWPIAAQGITPVPLWDDSHMLRRSGSNGYLHWGRIAVIRTNKAAPDPTSMTFAGREFDAPVIVSLDDIAHLTLDRDMTQRWNADPSASKLSRMVLGRPLQEGDYVGLVALHLMTPSTKPDGLWTTMWWSPVDRVIGNLGHPWDMYTLDATMDARYPLESDGGNNICFNPWLDGGLVDSGHGNGTQSNCISCHARAAIPARQFLTVTRGPTAPAADSKPSAMLWSVAIDRSSP